MAFFNISNYFIPSFRVDLSSLSSYMPFSTSSFLPFNSSSFNSYSLSKSSGNYYDFSFLKNASKSNLSSYVAPGFKTVDAGVRPKVTKSALGRSFVAEEVLSGHSINKCKGANLIKLKPEMKEILVKLDAKAKELGYTMVVSDGFRSHEAQIAAKKRKPKLCATPGKSAHEYGAAIDLAMYKGGKAVSIDKIQEFADYAQSLGLEWGATWKSKYEPWHFNFVQWQARADIKDEYNQWNAGRNYA